MTTPPEPWRAAYEAWWEPYREISKLPNGIRFTWLDVFAAGYLAREAEGGVLNREAVIAALQANLKWTRVAVGANGHQYTLGGFQETADAILALAAQQPQRTELHEKVAQEIEDGARPKASRFRLPEDAPHTKPQTVLEALVKAAGNAPTPDIAELVMDARKKAAYTDKHYDNASLGEMYRRLADALETLSGRMGDG